MGLPIEDLPRHDFFKFPYGQHIIIFSKADDGIRIEFIIKGCTDWLNHLRHWSK